MEDVPSQREHIHISAGPSHPTSRVTKDDMFKPNGKNTWGERGTRLPGQGSVMGCKLQHTGRTPPTSHGHVYTHGGVWKHWRELRWINFVGHHSHDQIFIVFM